MSLALALFGALVASPPLDLRFVDLQSVVSDRPEALRAAERLRAARAKAQSRIDARRQAFEAARAGLSESERAERERALEAEAEAAELALEAMQEGLLKPILQKLDRQRQALEGKGRLVVRLDQVALVGWPRACDLTPRLGGVQKSVPERSECRVVKFRVVDIDQLAAESAMAQRQEQAVDAFRRKQQVEIDELRRAVEAAERGGDPEAARQRAALDARTARVRAALEARKTQAVAAVYDEIYARLERAAQNLKNVAVVEKGAPALGLPVEDGQSWAAALMR